MRKPSPQIIAAQRRIHERMRAKGLDPANPEDRDTYIKDVVKKVQVEIRKIHERDNAITRAARG